MLLNSRSKPAFRTRLPLLMLTAMLLNSLLWLVLPTRTLAQRDSLQSHSATKTRPTNASLTSSPDHGSRIAAVSPEIPLHTVPQIPRRALQYQRSAYLLGLVHVGWRLLGFWLLLRSGLSARLRSMVYRLTFQKQVAAAKVPPFRVLALFVLLVFLFFRLWSLPIETAGFLLEHHFGFSTQSYGAFLADDLRGLLIQMIYLPIFWGVYWLHARKPRHWWLVVWAITLPLLGLVTIVEPVVVAPFYNHFTPLAPGPLRDRLLALAARSGIANAHIFVTDTSRRTKHVNAYVTGVGPTTRIVLNDTALKTLPQDQLIAMMGHEMGHYVEGHVWINLLTGGVGSGVILWLLAHMLPQATFRWRRRCHLRGTGDLAALPLAMLLLFLLLEAQLPLANLISRYLEHRADTFSLRLTHLNQASVRLYVGFAERDYLDPNPPLLFHVWFGTHPTLSERIDYALHFPPGTG